MTDELWTLAQLPNEVARLLGADYDGQQNGRVRELPNERAIRWYTTIGLVDRPATRGRTALYNRRHALQLAAIKRLQSRGRSLAEIQQELLGASDEQLATVAEPEPEHNTAFWRQRPTATNDTVTKTHGFRVSDTVAVVFDGTRPPTDDELDELTKAAAPLTAALERLGLAQRKERR